MSVKQTQASLVEVIAGEETQRIVCTAILVGHDLNVIIQGGDRSHIGAAAMAVPRPSLKNPEKMSATASVLTVTGHKEDELARLVALHLAAHLGCVTAVVAGIHVDGASEKDIADIVANVKIACHDLVQSIMKNRSLSE